MKPLIYSWIISLLSIIFIDSIWLTLMIPRFYRVYLGHIMNNFNYVPAAIFYSMYSFGISFLIVLPGLRAGAGSTQVALSGFILGLIAYGAYDLTNQATLKDWPLTVTIIDMAWGAILTAIVSLIGYELLPFLSDKKL